MNNENFKKKVRIGILTCSNTTRELDCPVGACLNDMYSRKGAFEIYKDREIELAGINSCNSCPTIKGNDVILPKIESLKFYGAEYIHIAYCMITICPFVKNYIKTIEKNYPDIKLIHGTHEPHQTDDKFRNDMAKILNHRYKTLIP